MKPCKTTTRAHAISPCNDTVAPGQVADPNPNDESVAVSQNEPNEDASTSEDNQNQPENEPENEPELNEPEDDQLN